MSKVAKTKVLKIDDVEYTIFPGGVVQVMDCNKSIIGKVSTKLLDSVVATATVYANATRNTDIGESNFDIDYEADGSVEFGSGDRTFSLRDLQLIQKLSKRMRK